MSDEAGVLIVCKDNVTPLLRRPKARVTAYLKKENLHLPKYEKVLREFNHVNPQEDEEGKEFAITEYEASLILTSKVGLKWEK
ncbi:hypothetical protein L1987_48467 [Smallanthus sonchifolius]|uniref:Uncharacterized protein n=1 Tax=Smallanthus sonchifolius TaxID=185202 RepID=A0ACB9FT06_9ASTR|nr:hypothetical protein L1987_48467 [Smallanthus sonchifolius]